MIFLIFFFWSAGASRASLDVLKTYALSGKHQAEVEGFAEYERAVVSPRCEVDVLVAVETGCCLQEAQLAQIKNVLHDFTSSLYESIAGDEHGLRLAMVSFGDQVNVSFNDSSERVFHSSVDELQLFGEPPQFNSLFDELPSHLRHFRKNARKSIILFTDGNGADDPNFEFLEGNNRFSIKTHFLRKATISILLNTFQGKTFFRYQT
jgi:hypothetical protein